MIKTQKMFRVLIIEDEVLIKDFLREKINHHFLELNRSCIIQTSTSCQKFLINVINPYCEFHLLLLNINTNTYSECGIQDGFLSGKLIRNKYPNIKVIVTTNIKIHSNLNSILKIIKPDACLHKSSCTYVDFKKAIEEILNGYSYFCSFFRDFTANNYIKHYNLDVFDLEILKELSLGSTFNELEKILLLSRRNLAYRKKALKDKLDVTSGSTRDLILRAKALKLIA